MALDEQSLTARNTPDIPFGGLGVSLETCEKYAEILHVQVFTWTPAVLDDGMAFHEPPVALFGYQLLTALGCEIRGR